MASEQSKMTVAEARAKKAEMIRQVREGTPPLWTPRPSWADNFTDDEIWEMWRETARDAKLSAVPMQVAAGLLCQVIDGKHP